MFKGNAEKAETFFGACEPRAAKFARAIDFCFKTDIRSDEKILQDSIALPGTCACNRSKNMVRTGSFMDYILNEESTDILGDDEIVWFICATSDGNKGARPLLWEKRNAERASFIAKEEQRYLATQAS